MRISDWSSDVCSSDLVEIVRRAVTIAFERQPLGAGRRSRGAVQFVFLPRQRGGIGERILDVAERAEHGLAIVGGKFVIIGLSNIDLRPPTADRKSTRLNSSH